MIIQCDKCDTKFKLDDSAIKGKGVKVKCTKCQNVFVVMPPASAPLEEPIAKPTPQRSPAEDLGLAPDKDEGWGLSGGSGAAESKSTSFGADFDFGEDEKAKPPVASGGLDDEFGAGSDAWGKKASPSKNLLSNDADDFGLDFGLGGAGVEKAPAQKGALGDAADDFGDFDFGTDKGGAPLFSAPDKTTDKGDDFGDFGDIDLSFGKEAPPAPPPPPAQAAKEEDDISFEAAMEDSKPVMAGEGKRPAQADAKEEEAEEKSNEIPGLDEQEEYLKDIEGASAGVAAPAAKKSFAVKKAVLVAVIFLIAIGAGLHLTGILDMLIGPKVEPKAQRIAFEGLKGFYVENEHAGKIFAIEGKVKNVSEEPQEISGVMANIYNKSGDKLISKTVSLGAMISNEELKTLAGEDIVKHFQDVSKGSIPPKGSSPVMFVFTAVPDGFSEFDVEVLR